VEARPPGDVCRLLRFALLNRAGASAKIRLPLYVLLRMTGGTMAQADFSSEFWQYSMRRAV
jgi:hypothetical protein